MSHAATNLGKRVRHELVQYWLICAYLYVCFAAIAFYKAAVLRANGVEYAPYGAAAIEALLVGKFILIGHAVRLGERRRPRRMAFALLTKAAVFLLFLMALCAAEEVVRGLIHGRTILASVRSLWGGTLLQVFATSLLMLLILIPYLAFKELARVVGPERLRAVLLARDGAA
ncbi:MAG: hypothetical protein JOY66_05735 [Acetobacteraceae bacterium]|nr:hypothetical protein [Acetobacteraceae bacterium]